MPRELQLAERLAPTNRFINVLNVEQRSAKQVPKFVAWAMFPRFVGGCRFQLAVPCGAKTDALKQACVLSILRPEQYGNVAPACCKARDTSTQLSRPVF